MYNIIVKYSVIVYRCFQDMKNKHMFVVNLSASYHYLAIIIIKSQVSFFFFLFMVRDDKGILKPVVRFGAVS